jgi:hypothetical protein
LNELPEVKETMTRQFGGRPVNEQNLSEWKSRGHREWLARQEALTHARELAADAQELTEVTDGRLTDHLATVLAARYAAALGGPLPRLGLYFPLMRGWREAPQGLAVPSKPPAPIPIRS